jgi:hypothetical protein
MVEYLSNLLPRLRSYSSQLDRVEVFVEKPWIFIDHNQQQHEYLFMRDQRLIMSLSGKVTIGRWELLPNNKLLIDRVTDQVMLQNMFIDDALMILQKSGSEDVPFTLLNERRIPDLDALHYLSTLEERNTVQAIPNDNSVRLTDTGMILAQWINVGDSIEPFDRGVTSGIFPVSGNDEKYAVVENNIIKAIYFVEAFTFNKQAVRIRQRYKGQITQGDRLENPASIPRTVPVEIISEQQGSFTVTFGVDGKVLNVKEENNYVAIAAVIAILAAIFFLIIIIAESK